MRDAALYTVGMRYVASDEARARAAKVRVILFDVDGVLTDGNIWLFPRPAGAAVSANEEKLAAMAHQVGYGTHSTDMVEAKGFSAHDGLGISLARIGGLQTGMITKRISDTVALRARDLKLEHLYMGQAHKMKAVREVLAKTGFGLDEVCFVGDDIVDLSVLTQCGLAVASANARDVVKEVCHWVTPNRGGHGAGRDAIEFVLEAQGSLDRCIAEYCDEHSPVAAAADIGQGGM